MKLPAAFGFAFVLLACAHAGPPQLARRELVADGGTRVVLRYAAGDAEAARQAERSLRGAVPVAASWGALPSALVVTIHPTHEALELAAHRLGNPWLRAWARRDSVEMQSPRTWSHGAASDDEIAQLLAHELTHCVLYRALGGDAGRARRIPGWFWEGMATTSAGERFATSGAPMKIDLLHPTDLVARTQPSLVYATADRAFRSLATRYGQDRIRRLVENLRTGAEFPEAFRAAIGVRLEDFEDDLRSDAGQEEDSQLNRSSLASSR